MKAEGAEGGVRGVAEDGLPLRKPVLGDPKEELRVLGGSPRREIALAVVRILLRPRARLALALGRRLALRPLGLHAGEAEGRQRRQRRAALSRVDGGGGRRGEARALLGDGVVEAAEGDEVGDERAACGEDPLAEPLLD